MPPAPEPTGGSADLASLLAALDHPGARRRFSATEGGSGGGSLGGSLGGSPEGDGWVALAERFDPSAVVAAAADDPVTGLGIVELTGSMVFHGLAVPLVDLVTSLFVTAGVAVALDPRRLWVRLAGHAVAEVVVDGGLAVSPAEADAVAAALTDVLDPVVSLVAPVDPVLRWGAVSDLVSVIAVGRSRAHGLDPNHAWTRAAALVAALRARRPHPEAAPVRLSVPGPDGSSLVLARRSTCCQWYRAARRLDDGSVSGVAVTDARCADCPSLDPATNVARLATLAAAGDLANP